MIIADETQEKRILEHLRCNGANWTSAKDLSQHALQYSRGIFRLRKEGFAIENKVVVVGGVRLGYFRLKQTPPMLRTAPDGSGETHRQKRLFRESEMAVRYADPEEAQR